MAETDAEQRPPGLGTGSDAGQRTDTIMMLYVPTTGKAALISIPRDSYVTIPGHDKNKINAAYSFEGPKLLVQTVEKLSGLTVDHYVEVGMTGVSQMVDAVLAQRFLQFSSSHASITGRACGVPVTQTITTSDPRASSAALA